MIETVKKTILAALRAVPMTTEEVRAVIAHLEQDGSITAEQSRLLLEALRIREGGGMDAGSTDRIGMDLRRLAGLLPFVGRGEFRDLAERVRRIEETLSLSRPSGAPAQATEAPPAGPLEATAPDEVPPGAEAASRAEQA